MFTLLELVYIVVGLEEDYGDVRIHNYYLSALDHYTLTVLWSAPSVALGWCGVLTPLGFEDFLIFPFTLVELLKDTSLNQKKKGERRGEGREKTQGNYSH